MSPISHAYASPSDLKEPLLVGHMMFTAPPRNPAANAGSTVVSLLVHGTLLGLAVYVTSLPAPRTFVGETISLIQIADDQPPPPPPPPPPQLEAQQPIRTVAEVPRGFQTLMAPTITPPDIPPPSPARITNEADFTGVGVEGGRADGAIATETRVVTADDISAAPTFTPYSVAPDLKNRSEIQRALVRLYPQMLKDAGVSGTTLVWLLVDEQGRVMRALVQQSSGTPQLDDAALQVARLMRFSPGLNHDVRVKVWMALPLTFKAVNA